MKKEKLLMETLYLKESAAELAFLILVVTGIATKSAISEYLKNKKKKKEQDKKKDEEKEKINEQGKKMCEKHNVTDFNSFKKFIVANTKKDLMKLKNSNEFKNKTKNVKSFKVGVKVFQDTLDELILEIVDGSQDTRIELSWIIDILEKGVRVNYQPMLDYLKISVSGGDGDEGCLYFENHNF
jgi:hypothetical protein